MKHVMVDLETLGTRAGCTILSIGAVAFDPEANELGAEMYNVISRNSCRDAGLFEEVETIEWWHRQNPDARQILTLPGIELADALAIFTDYLRCFGLDDVKVWGNGSDFDNAILANCYAALGQSLPWAFWNNRCYRTLKSLRPEIKFLRQGTYHNALDDAKSQAIHAMAIMRSLAGYV